MATISLYAGKINNMPSLIKDVRKSVEKYNKELSKLYQKALKVDGNVCDLSDVIDGIRASSQTQEQRIEILENFQNNSEDFIQDTIRIDNNVADTVDQNKDDFYDKYDYLKPDCEKSGWEKFCDACKSAWEWCKEHWKEILIVIELVVAVVCLFVPGLQGFGLLILENMIKGFLIGLLMGAVIGGLSGYAQYGVSGILGGILQGAQEGAMLGMAFGGLGGVGSLAGKLFGCSSFMTGLFYGSSALSFGMLGFDGLSLAYAFQTRFLQDTGIDLGLIDPTAGKFIFDLNQKAHAQEWYNTLQLVAGGTAAFSGGYVRTATCFIAGTMILTACGLTAIENIKAGDKVLSADPDTGISEEKTVLVSFHRTVSELVHLKIGSEVITTTHNHPFYVYGKGFINAGKLKISDYLLDCYHNKRKIDDISFETTEVPTNVYNFEVEDFHSYFVGKSLILVHNATCTPENQAKVKDHLEGNADNTGAKPNGSINGCHESNAFNNELSASGGHVVSSTPVEGMDGVSVVEYQTSSGTIKTKTVFDSSVISTEQYLNRGMEALGNVPGELADLGSGLVSAPDSFGVNWDIFVRNGEVISMYPNP